MGAKLMINPVSVTQSFWDVVCDIVGSTHLSRVAYSTAIWEPKHAGQWSRDFVLKMVALAAWVPSNGLRRELRRGSLYRLLCLNLHVYVHVLGNTHELTSSRTRFMH
jgi:hypothetical protein